MCICYANDSCVASHHVYHDIVFVGDVAYCELLCESHFYLKWPP